MIRTAESVREPPNWICVTISPKVGASPAADTLRVRPPSRQQQVKIFETERGCGRVEPLPEKRDEQLDRIVTGPHHALHNISDCGE